MSKTPEGLKDKIFVAFVAGYANPQLKTDELIVFFDDWWERNETAFEVYAQSKQQGDKCDNCGGTDQTTVNHWEYKWCLDCMRTAGHCLTCDCYIPHFVDDYYNYEPSCCPKCEADTITSPSTQQGGEGGDTLRNWMAIGYNIEKAALCFMEIYLEAIENKNSYDHVKKRVIEYICTGMFAPSTSDGEKGV